jgi:hypothetical protein
MSESKTSKKAKNTPEAGTAAKGEQNSETNQETVKPQGETKLQPGEEMELARCEKVLEEKLSGFDVGKALKAINDGKFYRAKFATFEQYCRERWSLSDKHAYRLIDAYTCVEALKAELSPNGEKVFPQYESQVRPLMALEPENRVKAWQKVLDSSEGKPITAEMVQAVVDKMAGKPAGKETDKPKTKPKEVEPTLAKIRTLVTKVLENDPEPTFAILKETLMKIRLLVEAD